MNRQQVGRWIRSATVAAAVLMLSACGFDTRPLDVVAARPARTCPGNVCPTSDAGSSAAGATSTTPAASIAGAAAPAPATTSTPAPVQAAAPTTAACLPAPTALPSSCDQVCCGAADGCCPSGCDSKSDPDCSSTCGDGIVEALETCEPGNRDALCRKSCDDGNRCTTDVMIGSAHNCNVRCVNTPITEPIDGDGCCPAGAVASNDLDCPAGPRCGNGVVEPDEECDGSPLCATNCRQRFQSSLIHRYSFDDVGITAVDSIGGANGTVIGASLAGHDLVLDGSRSHVALPPGLISPLTSATVELWVTWRGGSPGQRLFEFSNTGGDEQRDQGRAFWNLSPMNANNQLEVELNFTLHFDPMNTFEQHAPALSQNVMQHVAVSFDGPSHTMHLFVNGAPASPPQPAMGSLSDIQDQDAWLGLSQFDDDPGMRGVIHEFRIYNVALDPMQIAKSFRLGPDPAEILP